MSVIGQYVASFAEASHALPDGMPMNADYPFMLPRIVAADAKSVTIEGAGGARATFPIRRRNGREYGYIEQSSTFERLFNRKPSRFRMQPFKDRATPASSSARQPTGGRDDG